MRLLHFIVTAMFSAMLMSCSDEGDTARIVVRLTDSPGDYDKVNVDIRDIEVNDGQGWKSLGPVNQGIYNLLDPTEGRETVLTSASYPAGRINQIRLILGDDNSVEIDDEVFPLQTPSAQQSGLKLLVNKDLVGGITYAILLDFDAAKSVVHTGSGKYILKPVIRVVPEAQDGAIEGQVSPADLTVAVYAIVDEDTVASSYVQEGSTHFFIGGLAGGSYKVGFDPGELSGYQPDSLLNVNVTVGEVTNVGTTELSLQ